MTSGLISGQGLLGRVDLPLADAVGVVENLTLQVGGVDDVHVDDSEGTHAGRGQIEGCRRAETACTQQEHLRVEQLQLAGLPHLGQEEVALVAVALLGAEGPGRGPGTSFVLPAVEPARDRGDIGVAELLHGVGGERRAHPPGAHDQHVRRLVGDPPLDGALEIAPGQVHGAGQGALLVLVRLTHVEQDGSGPGQLGLGFLGGDLPDVGLGCGEHLSEGGHGGLAS